MMLVEAIIIVTADGRGAHMYSWWKRRLYIRLLGGLIIVITGGRGGSKGRFVCVRVDKDLTKNIIRGLG